MGVNICAIDIGNVILKLVQKHPIKGSREFELVDTEVRYSIQSLIKTESLSVVLNVLDPEPVVSGSTLSFISQVNREPLVELFLDKPDKEAFDEFVTEMQRRIKEEDFSRLRVQENSVDVNVDRVNESIDMLRTYVDSSELDEFLGLLSELRDNPNDVGCLSRVADAFNDLGFLQGQVITYAPYINFLLSDTTVQISHGNSETH